MQKVWIRFLGGMAAFLCINAVALYGLIELVVFFDSLHSGKSPYVIRFLLSLLFIIFMVVVLRFTVGKADKEIQEQRRQKGSGR